MAIRGRKPQSDAVREAKGNPGKRAARNQTAAPTAPGALAPPKTLRPGALAAWKEMVPELERMNFIRPSDRNAFARYCDALAHFWDVTKRLHAEGDTYITESLHGSMRRLSPLFLIQERLSKRLTDLEDRFGLSPSSRQQIMQRLAGDTPRLPLGPLSEAAQAAETDAAASPIPTPPPAPSPIGALSTKLH